MNKKEILIISLLICVIFSISAVSAADVSVNDANDTILTTHENDDVVAQVNDLSSYSLSNTNETVLGDGDAGSFKDLKDLIDSDTTGTITLEKNYTYNEATDSDLIASGIPVATDKIIQGNGQNIVIDGKGVSKLFQLTGTITLKGITFINGFTDVTSPIYSSASLTVSDCTFINNTGLTGGALRTDGSLTMEGCTFINNTASNGGAILTSSSPFSVTSISNSKFINNTANMGGSLYTSGIQTTLSNIEIYNGVADEDGGAILLNHRDMGGRPVPTNVCLTNITIRNSNATNNGGAIMVRGLVTSMNNITISDCNANNGGAIYLGAVSNVLDNLTLTRNSATTNGGAIYFWPNDITGTGKGLTNSNLTNNTAGGNGGAIYADGNTGKISTSAFVNNNASNGGAIYVHGNNWRLTNSTFTNNLAYDSIIADGNGGAIMWDGHNGIIDNVTFTANNATNRGGAMFVENCDNVTITNSGFDDNFAGVNGGAVEFYIFAVNGNVINSTFNNNIANRSGGAVFWYGNTGKIRNVRFTGNKALGNVMAPSSYGDNTTGGDGGAIMWTGLNGIVDNCTFTDNYASQRGGAVYLQGSVEGDCTNTTFSSCNFTSNEAGLNGGAIDWHEGAHDGLVTMSTFKDNIAASNGGAIFWSGHNGRILHSNFTNNSANGLLVDAHGNFGDGGAIIWSGINGTVDDCRFIDNNASQRGGGVFLQNCTHGNCTNTTFSHVYFENNYAGVNGGAIDWHAGAQNGHVNYGVFVNNTANRSGGAIFWFGKVGEISNSNFTGNKALGNVLYNNSFGNMTYGGHGGAIMWTGADGVIDNCTFIENKAKVNGGAIFMQGSTEGNCSNVTVSNGVFNDNFAGVNGGAVDWYKGARDCLLENATFNNNIANRSGGAVFWFGNHGSIKNVSFTNNSALGNVLYNNSFGNMTYGGHGGAIMWTGADGVIDNCTFIENKAKVNGGAIFMQGSTEGDCSNLHISNIVCEDNFAGVNGGAVDWYKGAYNCTLENATFTNNVANRSGGAVFWFGHLGSIKNATFTNNSALGNVNYTNSFGVNTTGGHGGAIMWTGADGIIDNCTFVDNEAKVNGGAIFMQGSTEGNCSNLHISNIVCEDNFAGVNGGAVDWYKGAYNCTLENATFTNNVANRSGGAVFWFGHLGSIKNATFTNNSALGNVLYNNSFGNMTYGGHGGAIMWTGADGIIDNCTFVDNEAKVNGGAIFLQGSTEGNCSNVTISNGIFKNNTAGVDGGAVEFYKGATNGHVLNSTFENNTAKTGRGGGVFWNGNNGQVINSSFSNNHARFDGGAVYIEGDDCLLTNSTFDSNTAGDDGGAIFWTGQHGKMYNITANNNSGISKNDALDESHSKGGTIIITGSDMAIDQLVVTDSFANEEAGGLFLTGNNVNLTNIYLSNCSASIDGSAQNNTKGGAMEIIGNNTRIINAVVEDSLAIDGGGIYWSGNDGYVYNLTAINNEAIEDGAALYISGDNCNILASNFTDNVAGDDGGAIYWQGHNGILDGSSFVHNIGTSTGDPSDPSTSKGGTLSIIGNNVDISNSNFTDSLTKNRGNDNTGGAIFITGNDVDIDGCNFNNCAAEGADGGTIYIIGNRTVVKNSNITDSTARAGGAIYIDGVNASVINSTLNNTFAKTGNSYTTNNLGGAVYIKGNNANIIGSEIENASAYQGGGLYLEGDYCNVTNSSVKEGYAYVDGGALYSTGSYSNVYFSNFTSNEARGDGGAMYWHGGKNSRNNTIVGCIFLENVAYANSDSNTKGGGAIYWSEGGYYGTIKDSQFINNSVQSTVKADGGAILWDKCHFAVIDNCIFDGDYIETTNTGDVWIQGGAIYLRVDDPYTISNSKFINCYSEKEAGALYVQSNTNGRKILIVNTTFINNVAQSIGQNSNGGGAIQVKQADIVILQNVTFINNTANQGGAVTVYDTRTNITFIDCTFDNNTANNGNGGSIWADKKFFIYNTTIANSTASGYGGGLYTKADLSYDNLTFINNTATSGGGLYWNKAGIKIQNMEFINNTALERGGGIYVTAGTATIQNVNMTGNKAFTGSAIWADKDITLVDVYLMENQANSSSLDISFDESTGKIVVLFKGKDKYLNAIYLNGGTKLYCTNVTYWDESGETNSGASKITWPTTTAQDTPEGGQNLTVRVYGGDGKLVEQNILTDNDGKVYLNLADIISDTNYHEMYVESELNDDTYYTIIKATTRSASQVNASANKTTYHSNSTLNVNVTQGATGNVSVYIGDTFIANITLDNSKGSINMSTLVEGVYLPVGNHTLSFVYNGNVKYDKSNTTAILEITKITPVMLLNVTGIGYNLLVNVTVMDGEYNITDATGNVTIQVEDRTATIYLGNGQGMTIIYGLPIGNYTVNATYPGDNNYYNITNSTEANVTEKTQTVLVLDVDSEKLYYINETVPIKVTILPKGEGNITLYINGIPHELTLQTVDNSTFVEFNATELKDGINYVFATYEGTEIYAPSWAQDRFNVTKYNSTIGIETANITFKDTEIINITLPEDAEGIIKVLINDTPYLVELVGGSAQVNVSDLAVGTYNVTVIFNGDKKYYNSTNSTLFNVTKIKPAIEIDVDNVTYGNETVITVILPDGVTGNVTIKVNDTILVYEEQEIVDGKVTLPGTILPAGNYTVEATYNGDGNYSVCTAQTNFTVYRQAPVLTVTVEDINYGESANITVTVPDGVTGTIIIKVNGTESEPLTITEGKVNLTVAGLAVGNYPVEVIYSGNDNYSDDTVTTDFEVFQIGTELDVDVHDITVWDTEYINITIKDAAGEIITNATGNVTINIDGVDYTAEIKDGVARLNTSNLTIGHKVVWAFYDGDRNLAGNRLMAQFDVTQRTPKVNVTALNITVGQDGKITINIPANATGHVILSGNFTNNPIYVSDFTNGVAEITVDNLAVGNYSVHIKYIGDSLDNYTVAENDTTFKVDTINTTISIDVESIDYGNKANITVTVNNNATGYITIRINETRNITLPVANGKVNWIVEDLAAGNYTVYANYSGDDKYNGNKTNKTFEVRQISPEIKIINVISTAGENATIIVEIDPRVSGNITVHVDKDYSVKPVNGIAVVTTDVLDYGNYTVNASYAGDKNFTKDYDIYKFTTNQTDDYLINITASDIEVGDNTNITVNVPSDATGKVVIVLDGNNYTVTIADGKAVLNNVSTLKEGVYNVTAYFGNDKYANKTVQTRFAVSKVDTPMKITVVNDTSIYVNDTVKVIVTVPSDVTKNVTIEINGMKFTNATVNGNATFYIPEITYGNKTVVATYPGDGKYRFNSTTANFTVNKRKSQVNVTVDAGLVGDDTVINVTIPANATGYVIVNVDGTNYTVNTTNGIGSVTIEGLGNTTHTVHVTYIGDDQYLPSENSTTFGIAKANTTIAIAVESINYGESANITVTVADDATGYITIRINETRNITLPVINGTVNWIVDGLAADNYTVYANYSGDGKYNVNETNKPFEVRQISPEIEIISVISTADNNATIIVKVDPRVTENITVNVNNKDYSAKPVNGIAVIVTDVLDYGTYTVNASYVGDKNFTKDYDIYEFTTNQTDDYLINITASDIEVGDNTNITVYVPSDATGTVIIELNGTTYTATIAEGKAVLNNVSTLKEGVYDVTAYFGDDKYVNKTVETRFAVSKVDTPIVITVINETGILVNDTVKVIVTVPEDVTDNVTIEINGVKYTNSTVDGNATFYIPEITFGDKTVVATYPGDDKYRFNSTTANFTVNKRKSQVNVTVDAGLVGDDTVINVTIPTNATGYVIVNVDGTNYTVNTTNGIGSVTIEGLGNTTHTVHVTYIGDDQYLPSENSTTFGIAKVNTTIAIAVESINYGESANITVTVADDATGYITIRINETRNITLPVINGTVNWIVDGLAADNYTVYANYSGDGKYNVNETNKPFEVRQISPEIEIISVISTADNNATIIVKVDPRVTENITVNVNNRDYSAKPVNGIAIITTDVLDYGTYTVNASYAGDKNFTKDYDTYEFTTNQTDDYLINITASDIEVGDNTNITVYVPSDATGTVIIELNGTNYTATIAEGKAVLNNVSTLKEGVYDVTAYFGDDKYVNKTVETRFAVSKVDTPITITVVNDTSIHVGDTVKVIVTVPEDVTENVTIEINGMEFTNSTVNGNATFYIPEITFGNKTVVATYPGDDKYRFNSTTAKFAVHKRDSYDMIVEVTEAINVGDVAQVNVTLPTNATGQVVVKVDGQNYTINLTDGKGSVEIKGLLNGTYPVEVTYLGDDQYASSANNTQEIKVNKIPSSVTVTVDNITVGDVAAVNITVITNATGNVTIVIGDEYNNTVGVVNGQFSVIVPGLSVGDKTVTVTYNGDDRFLPSEDSADFTVGKASAGIDIVVENITYGEIETIVAYVNATGNVTIKLNGDEIDVVNIENGKVEYPIERLNAGNYTVEVIYNGDATTNSTSAKANFTVAKADPTITIEVQDIIYGDVEHIVVHVNAEGNVTIKVNGQIVEELTLENGKAVLRASRWGPTPYNGNASVDVYNLAVGNYPVEVTFNGNENYNIATATDDFNVLKDNTSISVDYVPSMEYGDSQMINITVNNTNASGEVIINVDGKNYTRTLTDGKANFTIEGLAAGNHTVVVIYEGDANLTGNWTSLNIEVTKITPEITVNATNITVGDKTLIEVTAPSDVTGPVLVDVDGVGYYVNITDGKGSIEVPISKEGTYNVTARYLGDDKYTAASANNTFKASKAPSSVTVTVENITVGDKAIIEITVPSDATGNVTVTVDGKDYNVSVSGGKGTLVIPDLKAGDYPVSVKYLGDDKYEESTNSTEFTVSKIEVDIQVIDQNNGTLTIVVGDNATGNVTVKVGDEIYNATVIDGVATVDMVNNTPGTYDVEVIYSGDDRHTNGTATSQATIPKLATPISVEVDNINVGDTAQIVVNVPENATGNVTIEINGVKYTEEIKNGKATFNIENLTAGNKTIAVDYVGDDKYIGNHTTSNFTVSKVTPEIKMNVTVDGDTAIIDVEVPEDATRPVLVDVDGVGYYVNVTDGKGQLVLSNMSGGSHDVDAKYLGDDKYTKSDVVSKTFDVKNLPSNVTVKAENITYGEDAVIEVTVPSDATGNVTVTIDGKAYEANVSGGKAVVVVPDLKAGNHTVDVTYNGDDKYAPSSDSTVLEVSKAPIDNLIVIDKGNGTVEVVVPDNATGTVEIKVGDHIYNATIEDGVAVIDLVNETPGTYDLEVTYSGDENHTAANTTGTATIPKLATPISVTVENIKVGDKENIVVTVPDDATGNVTIEINGVKYTEEIKDGKATFEIENLAYGNKTVYVDYIGDNNYTGNHTSANFTVDKRQSAVKVDVEPINVGEDAVITVTVPQNATGYVIVEIDNQTYAIEVKDGTGSATIKGLASGDYPINVTYLGDDQYFNSTNATSLKVSKVPSSINVTVENITVGENAVINIEVPKDVCGNVTVSVDGKNYTVPVSGGQGTLVVPDLGVGNHTVDVKFEGCKKYEPSENSTKFTVSKVKTNETDIKVFDQGNGTVVVVVPDDATGTVEIKVGDHIYNATIEDGVAVIDLVNETPGTYDLNVTYSGDENHTAANTTGTATIPKLATPISVEVNNIHVGDTEVITVTVPENATGNVTIEIDGVKYTSEIKDGKAVFNIKNLTAGNKTIAVDYVGDDNYLGNHTTSNFTVSKCESQVSATITNSSVGENVTVTVTVPQDATGQVLIDIDGVGYYVNVTDGTGTLEIPRMPSGNYNVTVTYTGDDKYLPSNNTATFNVTKVESFVIPVAQDIYVGDNEDITISVPEDATGTVTVVIDGEEYIFHLNDGTLGSPIDPNKIYAVAVSGGNGKLVVSGLPKGEYVVSVRYNGDDKYLPSTNKTTFKVLKKSPSMDITDLGNRTVIVDLPDGATGTVEIKVGNNTYNATVVNGRASIDLTNETPGVHDIVVTYSGDETHESQVADSKVTIPKYDTPISVDVDDCLVGDTAVITVTVPDNATGNVTIEINAKSYTAEIKDGNAVFHVTGLEAGDKTVAVRYDGDSNYVGNSTTGQFTVSKRPSTVSATGKNINVGKDEVITVTVPKDATGRVLVDINGVGYYGTIVNGKAKVLIPELPAGKYTAKVTYEGDGKYLPSTTTTKFTVTKVKTPIIATGDEIDQGQDATVVIKVPNDATGTVTITVDGKKYTVEVKNGKAVFYVPGLTKGDYKVSASYSGDKKYEANDTVTDIEVYFHESPYHNGGGEGAMGLSKHATGNPILVLLLVILAIGSTQIRRFRK